MQGRHIGVMLLACVGSGCASPCMGPEIIDGLTYRMLANMTNYSESGVANSPVAYSPVNGITDWIIDWGTDEESGVSVSLDGQVYNAVGIWDSIDCGHFTLAFSGLYVSEIGSTHLFDVDGAFVAFDDQLEGIWRWDETWTVNEGTDEEQSGELSSFGSVRGSVLMQTE